MARTDLIPNCVTAGDTRSYGDSERHLNPAVVSCDETLTGHEASLLVRLACEQISAEVNLDLADDETMIGLTPDGGTTRVLAAGGISTIVVGSAGVAGFANNLPYMHYSIANINLNNNEWSYLRSDVYGNLRVTLNAIFEEDSVHVSADPGVQVLSVRKDLPTALAGNDGDYQPLVTNNLGAIYTSEVPSVALGSGQATVANAGTRAQLTAASCKSITIKAKTTNTGLIYVGGSAVAAANGFILGAGDTLSLDVNNADLIYIDSSVSGEGISYIYVN